MQIGADEQNYIYSIVQTGIPFEVVNEGDRAYLVNIVELDRETSPSWTFTVSFANSV